MKRKEILRQSLDKVFIQDYKIIHFKKTGYFRVYLPSSLGKNHNMCVAVIDESAIDIKDMLDAYIADMMFETRNNPYILKPKIIKEIDDRQLNLLETKNDNE